MSKKFDRAVALVIESEGGARYTHYAADPGGATKYGISQRAYPALDIAALTEEQAREIYYRDYWTPLGCEFLPWPLCYVLFDTGVLHGPTKAKLWYSSADWRDILWQRLKHYSRSNNVGFVRGWLNRTLAVWEASKAEWKEV
jgi:lysozyme family protein